MDSLWSDPLRHWQNGALFPRGGYWGASDPIVYQVYIFLLGSDLGSHAMDLLSRSTKSWIPENTVPVGVDSTRLDSVAAYHLPLRNDGDSVAGSGWRRGVVYREVSS